MTRGPELEQLERPLDGRNVDPAMGTLAGEGARLEADARRLARAWPGEQVPWQHVPSERVEEALATYYDQPLLHEPVWKWYIPAYFYVGGAAGATSVMAAAAEAFGGRALKPLVKKAHRVGFLGDALSAALLIIDLGRPLRFLNMLRVFRPSSPMNLGTWVLSASGAANFAAVLLGERRGLLGAVGKIGGLMAGLFGLPLTGYTAVLLTNTAVPVWKGAQRSLPPLFVATSAASAGSIFELLAHEPAERRVARTFAIAGKAATLAGMVAVEREVRRVPRVGRPLATGVSGAMWQAAKIGTAAALVCSLLPGSRKQRLAAGVIGTAAALALRFAVAQAGKASARDPRATTAQQRR